MRVKQLKRICFFCVMSLCLSWAFGCGEVHEPNRSIEEGPHPRLSVGKRDGQRELWRADVDGVGIWIDLRWATVFENHRVKWSILLGADEPIMLRRAGFRDQDFAWVRQDLSTYRLELTGDQFLRALSEETPFFEFVVESSGSVYSATFEVGAQFENFHGTPRAFVEPEIEAVFLGRRLFLRGHLVCEDGFSVEGVYRDDGAEPVLSRGDGYRWRMDWNPQSFLRVAENPKERTTWIVRDSDDTFSEKAAGMALSVSSFAVREGAFPDGASSLECDGDVLRCLDSLSTDNLDSSSCGNARQIKACLASVLAPALGGRRRFAQDLEVEVDAYYRLFSEEIRSGSGRTLDEARSLIAVSKVQLVDDIEESAFARYPTSHYDVYRHPDVIFENSEMIWYGVYDAGGGLVEVFAVNSSI